MRRRLLCLAGLGFLNAVHAFEEKPWLGNFLEFYLDSSFTYYRFRHVENAIKQPKTPSNNYLLNFDLGFTPFDGWEVAAECELAQTPRQNFGRRSLAVQLRTRWMDDIMGDPVSWTTGVTARQVASDSVHDISSPYAAPWDFELHAAIGNEWSHGPFWYMRWYGVAALGQGNRGSPWTRARLAFELNRDNRHQLEFFGDGYWGFGRRRRVDIQHFNGWGKYDHSSVDLGFGYRYVVGVWGYLWLEYSHRVYARSYPQAQNTFQIGYHLPFSFFTTTFCP